MSDETKTQLERFADELDEFIDRWESKETDDRLSMAEMTATLQFKAFTIMADARERYRGV